MYKDRTKGNLAILYRLCVWCGNTPAQSLWVVTMHTGVTAEKHANPVSLKLVTLP